MLRTVDSGELSVDPASNERVLIARDSAKDQMQSHRTADTQGSANLSLTPGDLLYSSQSLPSNAWLG
ncbi:hypothetical protein OPT61_g3589 [Boeremia exigua]|uniref:Uncharacterized protein n=1 Tax=Boeremia exigua TaxID=749465 RepID=A0ACC2IHE4_9PLEO|nr:hypothetical protein OPT61_g3589 [Boeremia exigua]